jgi:cell division protein FtsQ
VARPSERLQPGFAFARLAPSGPEEGVTRRALKRGRIREMFRIGVVVLAFACAPVAYLAWQEGYLAAWKETASDRILQASAAAGFRLEHISASGEKRTPDEAILEALAVNEGEPLFALDMAELRRRVETLPWVKRAVVSRELPGTLRVFIEERQPIARWQMNGDVVLVDAEGAVIAHPPLLEFASLPLLVGPGAPEEGAKLLALLQAEPDVAARVSAAIRVGRRRWDIEFDNGQRLKLPENTGTYGPATAWAAFAKLARDDDALAMEVASFDLRLPGRIVMKMTAGGERALAAGEGRT